MRIISYPSPAVPLPVYITGIGLDYPQEAICRPGGYEDYQWLETVEGAGELIFENKSYSINAGMGFLLPKNTAHSYHPVTGKWTVQWVTFNGNAVSDYCRLLNIPSFLLSRESLSPFLRQAVALEGELDGAVKNSALLLQLLCQLARKGEHTAIAPAVAYMKENYASDITLTQLSDTVGLTPQHFCKLFLKYTGVRPIAYLAKLRVAKSKELMLQNKELSVQQVANQVGYHSYQYFIRVFKNLEGISPGAFKKLF